MTRRKPKPISRRMERLLQLQVQEYIDRYYPHWGEVDISISPDGTVAAVKEASSPSTKRAVKGRNRHGTVVR